jgi:NAD(P)-dependent dehydrogenase (short-subunit alcohol dehydrogenase family)
VYNLFQMKKLKDKVAVITGGSSGIGLGTAKLFAENGAKVTITGRNKETLENAAAQIGNGAIGLVNDVAKVETIDSLYKKVHETFGKIDVLVVNAGIYNAVPLVDFTEKLFDEMIATNFKGAFFSVQKALPYLNDGASIILTGSTASHVALPKVSVYGATKAALGSLAKNISLELLDRKIRVNVISPGPIDTPVFDRIGGTKDEVAALKLAYAAAIPVKRMGTVEEIAQGFLYLASDDSSFMLGSELLIGGGRGTL